MDKNLLLKWHADEALSQLKQLCKDFPAETLLFSEAGYDEGRLSELILWMDEHYVSIDLYRYRYLLHMTPEQVELLQLRYSESGERAYPEQFDDAELAAFMRYLISLGAWGAVVCASGDFNYDPDGSGLPEMILNMYTAGLCYIEDQFLEQHLPADNEEEACDLESF